MFRSLLYEHQNAVNRNAMPEHHYFKRTCCSYHQTKCIDIVEDPLIPDRPCDTGNTLNLYL